MGDVGYKYSIFVCANVIHQLNQQIPLIHVTYKLYEYSLKYYIV